MQRIYENDWNDFVRMAQGIVLRQWDMLFYIKPLDVTVG